MITRLYVNNFRCLVNFKTEFDSFAVLCGPNGAGKSSVYDAIQLLRNLGTGSGVLGGTGKADVQNLELTSWLTSKVQEFELDLSIDRHRFQYRLHIEQKADFEKPRVVHERVACDDDVLLERGLDGVEFQISSGNRAGFPLDWRVSALAAVQPRGAKLQKLGLLQDEIAKLLIVRPNPRDMESESRAEVKYPDLSIGNLTSWYRTLSQEQEWTDALRDALRSVWPDFRSFKLVDTGTNTKSLQLRFESKSSEATALSFSQLSDGERALIGLYMIRAALETNAVHTVMLDEPDNFVGLPELQPWVLSLRELLDDSHQAILISHHPEILSNVGDEYGRYLWRDNHTSPTRIGPLRVPEGLSAGEAIARGWVRAG